MLIRLLAYCAEADIAEYAAQQGFPDHAVHLCGSQENLQRKTIKAMLLEWEKKSGPHRDDLPERSATSRCPSQPIAACSDFAGLGIARVAAEMRGRARWLGKGIRPEAMRLSGEGHPSRTRSRWIPAIVGMTAEGTVVSPCDPVRPSHRLPIPNPQSRPFHASQPDPLPRFPESTATSQISKP